MSENPTCSACGCEQHPEQHPDEMCRRIVAMAAEMTGTRSMMEHLSRDVIEARYERDAAARLIDEMDVVSVDRMALVAALREERDELRAALRDLVGHVPAGGCPWSDSYVAAWRRATALLQRSALEVAS